MFHVNWSLRGTSSQYPVTKCRHSPFSRLSRDLNFPLFSHLFWESDRTSFTIYFWDRTSFSTFFDRIFHFSLRSNFPLIPKIGHQFPLSPFLRSDIIFHFFQSARFTVTVTCDQTPFCTFWWDRTSPCSEIGHWLKSDLRMRRRPISKKWGKEKENRAPGTHLGTHLGTLCPVIR